MRLASDAFFQEQVASGLSLFEVLYLKVEKQPDLMKVLSFVLPFWDRMEDRDRANWRDILSRDDQEEWDRFYREHISDCEYCRKDDQLLWLQLVPTRNVDYEELMKIGHSLDCLGFDVLKEVDRQCEPGSWQRKLMVQLGVHTMQAQSDVLKGFLLCFLLGKVSNADMEAIWENELQRLFDMMGKHSLKDKAMQCLEHLAERCTTDLSSQHSSHQWTIYRYKNQTADTFRTYPHTVAAEIELGLHLGNSTFTTKGFIPSGTERHFRFNLKDLNKITSHAGGGSALMEVRPEVVPHPLACLQWTSVCRQLDKGDTPIETWSPLDFATVTATAKEPGVKALYDEIAAMLPNRLVHHVTLINNQEQTLVFLRQIAELKAAGFRYDIVPAFHGPSNWSVVDKIVAQGFRHSRVSTSNGEHSNLVPVSNGQFYGTGVYFDRPGCDQGDGCGYGQQVDGSFIGLTIHFWKPTSNDVPTYTSFSTPRDPNATVFRAGASKAWSVVKDPTLTLVTAFVHHTFTGQAQRYPPEHLIDRFRNSTEERSLQITRNGPEAYRELEYDLRRLPEIPMGTCLVPRPSDINLLPPSMRPEDGDAIQAVLPVGSIGVKVRQSRAMCWEPTNLGDEIPDMSPLKRRLADQQTPAAKRAKPAAKPAQASNKKKKADPNAMKPNHNAWYKRNFTAYRSWQKRINLQIRTSPPVKPTAFAPTQAPIDLDTSQLAFPWDAADQHLQKKMQQYNLNTTRPNPLPFVAQPIPVPAPPVAPASPNLQPVANRPPTPAAAIDLSSDSDDDTIPMVDDGTTLKSVSDDSDSDFDPDSD